MEVLLDDEADLDDLRAAFRVEVDGLRLRAALGAHGLAFTPDGRVRVDGRAVLVGDPRLRVGQRVVVLGAGADPRLLPERLPIRVLVETDRVLVVDKPAGMAVTPGTGHPAGTLANALRGLGIALSSVEGPLRPGIVHRLDRGTSGAMLIAKTDDAHAALIELFLARSVHRRYAALVAGDPPWDALTIDAPLGAPRKGRKSVRVGMGKAAVTHVRVALRCGTHARIECTLETGRTHQIRAHLAHAGHPLLGDTLYGGRADRSLWGRLGVRRPALHAERLVVETFGVDAAAPWPDDLARAII